MIRTDLALEARESFPEDDVEIKGVILKEEKADEKGITVTVLEIKNEEAAEVMGKPVGTYITIEAGDLEEEEALAKEIQKYLKQLMGDTKNKSILVAGLGNREVTPDALGPMVVDALFATRHLIREFGEPFKKRNQMEMLSAIAPGVMAQTGMESREILEGVAASTRPDWIVVVDALAARSIYRLNRTIQITDTGISPGSGVGNNRNALNEQSLGTKVIAIGVPTVVDASTIVEDRMREALAKQNFSMEEIEAFLRQVNEGAMHNMFVTPKDVDEAVERISAIISRAVNAMCYEGC